MGKFRAAWVVGLIAVGIGLLIALSGDEEEFPDEDPIEIDV